MSKKDFEAIAAIIRAEREVPENDDKIRCGGENASGIIAERLADYFLTVNPRFDRQRFLKAAAADGRGC